MLALILVEGHLPLVVAAMALSLVRSHLAGMFTKLLLLTYCERIRAGTETKSAADGNVTCTASWTSDPMPHRARGREGRRRGAPGSVVRYSLRLMSDSKSNRICNGALQANGIGHANKSTLGAFPLLIPIVPSLAVNCSFELQSLDWRMVRRGRFLVVLSSLRSIRCDHRVACASTDAARSAWRSMYAVPYLKYFVWIAAAA